jgi:hypothetical protein
MRRKPFYCQHCGSDEAHPSRSRTFVEKRLLPLLLLRPVRCEHCDRRYYRSVSVAVNERTVPTGTRRTAA